MGSSCTKRKRKLESSLLHRARKKYSDSLRNEGSHAESTLVTSCIDSIAGNPDRLRDCADSAIHALGGGLATEVLQGLVQCVSLQFRTASVPWNCIRLLHVYTCMYGALKATQLRTLSYVL